MTPTPTPTLARPMIRPQVVDEWFLLPAPVAQPRYRLFCFPHAGGDATAFRPLATALAPQVEVWGVRLPGRGGRLADPLPATFDELVAAVGQVISGHTHGRFGFYGQSFGALLAYEVARALPPDARPDCVVAASANPPGTWRPGVRLPQPVEAPRLLDLAGSRELLGGDPELRDLALRVVRGDLALCSTYRYRPGRLHASALHAVVGDADPLVGARELAGWRDAVAGPFELTVVPGGHLLATAVSAGPVDLLRQVARRHDRREER